MPSKSLLITRATAVPLVGGNKVRLLENGTDFFPALLSAIENAQSEIRLETYIFFDDTTGQAVRDALARAATRGVRVHVLTDGIGSRALPTTFFTPLQAAGGQLQIFRPDKKLLALNRSRLRRTHRKLIVIDERIGFVGGINIIDDLTESLSEHPRFDYAVQIEGPVLEPIRATMLKLWRSASIFQRLQAKLSRRDGIESAAPKLVSLTQPIEAGSTLAAFIERDNVRHRREIERSYLFAFLTAKKTILICNPYFLPGRKLRLALRRAAKKGVQVTILLQGLPDHPLLKLATEALYTQLLGANIVIAEYTKSMLHGKAAVVDGEWSTVGSSNLDPFSLFLNREANIVIKEEKFAAELTTSIQRAIAHDAVLVNPQEWAKRSWWQRSKAWMAYGLSRVMGRTLGIGD
jgi:cardiolipin synthase A/B